MSVLLRQTIAVLEAAFKSTWASTSMNPLAGTVTVTLVSSVVQEVANAVC